MKVVTVDMSDGGGHHLFYATALTQTLQRLGVSVHFVGSDSMAVDMKHVPNAVGMGVPVSTDFFNLPRKVKAARSALDAAQAFNPDVIHWLYGDRWLIPLARTITRQRSISSVFHVVSLHWAYMVKPYSQFPASVKDYLEVLSLKRLISAGVRVVVHNKAIAHLVEEVGVHCEVAPYPVTIPPDVSTRLKHVTPDIRILCFGGTRYDKGADLAVQILAALPANFRLAIVGKPVDFSRAFLLKCAARLGVEKRVTVVDSYVPDSGVATYFQEADVVLLPYRNRFAGESGPLGMAAALGRPIVCSALPQFSEVLEAFELGSVYPVGDVRAAALAIKRVARMQPRYASEYAKSRSVERFGDAILRVYLDSGAVRTPGAIVATDDRKEF